MNAYEIRGVPLDLIKSYLAERGQQVLVGADVSSMGRVLCGVPQGNVMGPLLFLLYVADLPRCLPPRVTTVQFADDTSFIFNLPTNHGVVLAAAREWFNINFLQLNEANPNMLLLSSVLGMCRRDDGYPHCNLKRGGWRRDFCRGHTTRWRNLLSWVSELCSIVIMFYT